MMQAWSFAARMVDEVARLLRTLGKNRYVSEVDHRLHWSVDAALVDLPSFAEHARAFDARRKAEPQLELGSRDPSLWRSASVEEVIAVLTAFWGPGEEVAARCERLADALDQAGIEVPEQEPFTSDPDEPPFPELILLDWVLLAVDELDTEQHAGALASLEASGEPVDTPSDPVWIEGPSIGPIELVEGAPHGFLEEDLLIWADGPFAYVDYVFRGASKAAKLVDPPESPRDLDAAETTGSG